MIAGTRRVLLRFAVGLAGISVALVSTPRMAEAQTVALACPRAEPAVHLDASVPEPVIDNSKPQRAIQALAPAYHGGRSIGLYYAEVQATIEMQFRSVAIRGGAPACTFITAIDIRVVMPVRRIYVSSELWPQTCPYTAVLAHERKHEATDDEMVRKHAPRLKQVVQEAAANLGPVQTSTDAHDAQARLQKGVRAAFDKAWAAFMAERSELQRQVDAGLEYARVTASCPDWSQLRR